MNDIKAKSIIKEADKLLDLAQEELSRPEEDVIPYMVCRNAYKSVDKYLTGFLLNHEIEIHSSTSLGVLLDSCRQIDTQFDSLNLDPLYSTKEPEYVWTDMGTVKEFMELATQTRKLVSHG